MLGVVRLGGGKRPMGDGKGMYKPGGAGGQVEKGSLSDLGHSPHTQKTSPGKPFQSFSDMWLSPPNWAIQMAVVLGSRVPGKG